MRKDVDILTHFKAYAAAVGSNKGIERAVNALIIAGIHSMERLCGIACEELLKVRGIGEKSIELIALVRRRYLAEQDLSGLNES